MSQSNNALETYGFKELGRHTIDGVQWVAYDDGDGIQVVSAADVDRNDWTPNMPDEDFPFEIVKYNYGSEFCRLAKFADESTHEILRRLSHELTL